MTDMDPTVQCAESNSPRVHRVTKDGWTLGEYRWTPATMERMLIEIERRLDTRMHIATTDQFVAGVRHLSSIIINEVFHDPENEAPPYVPPCPTVARERVKSWPDGPMADLLPFNEPSAYADSRQQGYAALNEKLRGPNDFPEPLGYRQ